MLRRRQRTAIPVASWTRRQERDIILVLEHRHGIPPPGAATTQVGVRLTLSPSSTADDVVNGGWWPRTRDPATELPALATAVAGRLGVVRRIALNADAWTSWPHQLVIIGGPRVRLDWCTGDAHTIRLTGGDAVHLDLLAIPPDTPTLLALTCLATAARDMSPPDRPGAPSGMQPATALTARHLHRLFLQSLSAARLMNHTRNLNPRTS